MMTVWIVVREQPLEIMAVHADEAAAESDLIKRHYASGGIRYRLEKWAVQQ